MTSNGWKIESFSDRTKLTSQASILELRADNILCNPGSQTSVTTGSFESTATSPVTVNGDLIVDTNTLVVTGGNVGIGKTNPSVRLDIVGSMTLSGTTTANTLSGTLSSGAQGSITSVGTLDSLTVSGSVAVDTNTLVVSSGNVGIVKTTPGYKLDVGGDVNFSGTLYKSGTDYPDGFNPYSISSYTWTSRTSNSVNWRKVIWIKELSRFVSVGDSGGYMTSSDGITWSASSTTTNNWISVAWSPTLSRMVAVAITGASNSAMYSADGLTWTLSSPTLNDWTDVIWVPELSLFVACGASGTGDRIMTSSDGINWTTNTTPADNQWYALAWSPELGIIVAVSITGTGNRVMTSRDGINWTIRSSPADLSWRSITWSSESRIFVAVSITGTGNRVMTSLDGMTWTLGTTPEDNEWYGVTWAKEAELFVAVSATGTNRVMTSPDGLTWTSRPAAAANSWYSVAWSPELYRFAATAFGGGATNRIMTWDIPTRLWKSLSSGSVFTSSLSIGIGTTTPTQALDVNGTFSNQGQLTVEGFLKYSITEISTENVNPSFSYNILDTDVTTTFELISISNTAENQGRRLTLVNKNPVNVTASINVRQTIGGTILYNVVIGNSKSFVFYNDVWEREN